MPVQVRPPAPFRISHGYSTLRSGLRWGDATRRRPLGRCGALCSKFLLLVAQPIPLILNSLFAGCCPPTQTVRLGLRLIFLPALFYVSHGYSTFHFSLWGAARGEGEPLVVIMLWARSFSLSESAIFVWISLSNKPKCRLCFGGVSLTCVVSCLVARFDLLYSFYSYNNSFLLGRYFV